MKITLNPFQLRTLAEAAAAKRMTPAAWSRRALVQKSTHDAARARMRKFLRESPVRPDSAN